MQHASLEASFGRAADRYLKYAGVQRDLAAWLAEWLPADRRGAALELGAGPGVFTEFALPWDDRYIATDLSAAMCNAGRKRFANIAWHRSAAEHPPAGPWHWIFTSSMLQWVQDPVGVLEACRKVMAPGGRLLAGIFIAPTLPEWQSVLPRGARLPLCWRSADEWASAAERTGWRVLRSQVETRTTVYPTAREFLRSLHAVGAAPRRVLPASSLRRILAIYDVRFRCAVARVAEPGPRAEPRGGSASDVAGSGVSDPGYSAPGVTTPPMGVRSSWTFFRIEVSN